MIDSIQKIAFIGAGNMASALIGGLIEKGWRAEQFSVADPYPAALENLTAKHAVEIAADNAAAVRTADLVVLAVKPQVMKDALTQCQAALTERKPLLISIAAGITIDQLADWTSAEQAIVRCMPNTPALVKLGASGLFANTKVSEAQREGATAVLNAVGITHWLETEAQIDAVTAVSGSGPAYFFLVMEAMQATAINMGLSADAAREMVQQTALGAAQMAIASDVEVAELRRQVTSPGGTTQEAVGVLQDGELEALFDKALKAAQRRSIELAQA